MDMAIDPVEPAVVNGGDSTTTTTTTSTTTTSAAAVLQSSASPRVAESLKLEYQFVRVPLEHLKKTIRSNQRLADKDISAILSDSSFSPNNDNNNNNNNFNSSSSVVVMSPEDAVNHLNSLVSRLQGLKRKLEEGSQAEELQTQRCRARLEHLSSFTVDNIAAWDDNKLKRILVDYMLRMSYYDSAAKLAEAANIQDLVDVDVFLEAKRVVDSLQNREVAPALAWCIENRSRLKKSKSKLEFLLRLQEFVELVKAANFMQAIAYARKYLAPWGNTHMKDLQRVMATLVFRSSTNCASYKVLFEPKQWDLLVEQFKQEFCKLFGMTNEPLLNIYLQAGLSALKTPFCYEGNCPKEDPLSLEGFRKLAEQLPFCKQHHSKLVCHITKELMDSENPPLVLPNGYVYSTKALEEMAKKNGGKITCPRTGDVCNFSELVKAFIS